MPQWLLVGVQCFCLNFPVKAKLLSSFLCSDIYLYFGKNVCSFLIPLLISARAADEPHKLVAPLDGDVTLLPLTRWNFHFHIYKNTRSFYEVWLFFFSCIISKIKMYALSQTSTSLDDLSILKRHITNQHVLVAAAKEGTRQPAHLKKLYCWWASELHYGCKTQYEVKWLGFS